MALVRCERHPLCVEEQRHAAGLAIAIFADVDVGDTGRVAVLVVDFLAIQHQHDEARQHGGDDALANLALACDRLISTRAPT